jgi:hypothetical protein
MRKSLLFGFFAILALGLKAQPSATEGTTRVDRTIQAAAIIEVPYPESVVLKAINDYMSMKGFRGSDALGGRVFRSYRLRPTHSYLSDLYFFTDRRSKKEKDITVVSLVVGINNEDIKKRTAPDMTSLDGGRELLNEMLASFESQNTDVQIREEEELVKKAQKKYDLMLLEQADYEKKIKSLQDKLAELKESQRKQLEELTRQKGIMDALIGKRRS